MSELKPGWVDSIAAAVKSNDETTRADALGYKPRKRLRIDAGRLAASAARGGRIGGRVRKENYAAKRS
jgi:hypothetical protein